MDEARELAVKAEVMDGAPPAGRPALRKAGVVVVVMLLAAWIAYQETRPAPPPALTPVATTSAAPVPDLIVAAAPPAGLDLGTLVAPTDPPRLIDVRHGINRRVVGIPRGRDYRVAQVGSGDFLVTGRDPRGPARAFLVRADSATAIQIAAGDVIVPGADGASVLVSRSGPDGAPVVQRYDLSARAVGAPVSLQPDEVLVHEMAAGWLIASGGEWLLRNPASGLLAHRFPTVYAAGALALAHPAPAARLAVLRLTPAGLPQPFGELYTSPPAAIVVGAAFSADGRFLAVDGADRTLTVHVVAVLDTVDGSWSVLPGTPVHMDPQSPALALTWAADVLSVVTAGDRVILWRPGSSTAYAAPAAG